MASICDLEQAMAEQAMEHHYRREMERRQRDQQYGQPYTGAAGGLAGLQNQNSGVGQAQPPPKPAGLSPRQKRLLLLTC